MKYLKFVLAGSFTFLSSASYSQVNSNDSINISRHIITIEQRLMDAIAIGDTALWNKYLDESFYVITEDGTGFNKKDFLESMHPLPKGYSGEIKVIAPHFVFKNDLLVIHFVADEYETVFNQHLHTTYAVTDTYIKAGSSWKIIASQLFEIPQLPAAIKLPVQVLQKYTGTYQLKDTVTCGISLINDTLFMQKKGRKKDALLAETENVFFRMADTRGRKIFSKDSTGFMIMRERRNGQDLVWKRISD